MFGKALILVLRMVENGSLRDDWEPPEFFIISVGTCRHIEIKTILQILSFHSLGHFISDIQITQTVILV